MAVWFADSTLVRGWHTEQRSWTRVSPSRADVEEGVEVVLLDEQALMNMISAMSNKRMAADLIFIISPR